MTFEPLGDVRGETMAKNEYSAGKPAEEEKTENPWVEIRNSETNPTDERERGKLWLNCSFTLLLFQFEAHTSFSQFLSDLTLVLPSGSLAANCESSRLSIFWKSVISFIYFWTRTQKELIMFGEHDPHLEKNEKEKKLILWCSWWNAKMGVSDAFFPPSEFMSLSVFAFWRERNESFRATHGRNRKVDILKSSSFLVSHSKRK